MNIKLLVIVTIIILIFVILYVCRQKISTFSNTDNIDNTLIDNLYNFLIDQKDDNYAEYITWILNNPEIPDSFLQMSIYYHMKELKKEKKLDKMFIKNKLDNSK